MRHTNGLWLPVQFLVALDDGAPQQVAAAEAAAAQAQVDSAAATPLELADAGGAAPAAAGATATIEPSAVDDAKDAQRQRLERLPAAPSSQARPSMRLTLEMSPSAAQPSEPHLKYLRLGGKVADSLRRSDQSKVCLTSTFSPVTYFHTSLKSPCAERPNAPPTSMRTRSCWPSRRSAAPFMFWTSLAGRSAGSTRTPCRCTPSTSIRTANTSRAVATCVATWHPGWRSIA